MQENWYGINCNLIYKSSLIRNRIHIQRTAGSGLAKNECGSTVLVSCITSHVKHSTNKGGTPRWYLPTVDDQVGELPRNLHGTLLPP